MGAEICSKKEFGTHCRLKKKLFNGLLTNTFIDYMSQMFSTFDGYCIFGCILKNH